MATSLTGPFLTDMASAAAPVPRPPQPIKATRIVLSSAAWTCGTTTPANAVAAAILPVFFRNSRRDADCLSGFIRFAPRQENRKEGEAGWSSSHGVLRRQPQSRSPKGHSRHCTEDLGE